MAVLYAREGADVAIVYLNEHEDAEDTKRAVEKEGPPLHPASQATSPIASSARRRWRKTVKEFGKLDILVNNAAFQEHVNDFEDLTEEHFDRTLKTNLYGYFYMAQAAVPQMKPGGAIVMTGSVTGLLGQQGPARLLDDQGRHPRLHALAGDASVDRGIRVNAVAPGPVGRR